MNKSYIKLIYEKHLRTAEGTRIRIVNTSKKRGKSQRESLIFCILWLDVYNNSQCRLEDEYTGYVPNRKLMSEKPAELLVE